MFNPHAGDRAMIAVMKDIVEEMALVTDRKTVWSDIKTKRKASLGRRVSRSLSCSSVPPMTPLRKLSCSGSRSAIDQGLAHATTSREDFSSCSIILSCCREDAIADAQVLRSALAVRLDQDVAIGGTSTLPQKRLAESEALVVLLTKGVIHNADVLFEIFTALHNGVAIVPVNLLGRGYDFETAAQTLAMVQFAAIWRERSLRKSSHEPGGTIPSPSRGGSNTSNLSNPRREGLNSSEPDRLARLMRTSKVQSRSSDSTTRTEQIVDGAESQSHVSSTLDRTTCLKSAAFAPSHSLY